MKQAIAGIIVLLTISTCLFGQVPKSHEECIKRVPSDWGPNFGAEWHHNEAAYWGCRLGVPTETVATWQKTANESGMAQQISTSKVEGRTLVLIEEMAGDAHCFDITVLASSDRDWRIVWRLPVPQDSMDYCTNTCPSLKTSITGHTLTIESPEPTDPQQDTTLTCAHFRWRKETFHWTGETFKP